MKFRELVDEDASAGATVAADIAHVSYPLFVKGKTPRQRRRNARMAIGQKADSAPNFIGKGVYEAHALDNNSVIYRLDAADPMNATEVLVLGGAGRYSLKGLREKARREANELAANLKSEHGGSFRDAAYNIKQLANTLNTIVAAYNELRRIRSKGGRGSRGITDEDTTFIREFMTTVLSWVGKSSLTEDEKDEIERQGQLINWPAGTAMVDVSDVYDWYKIGMSISDLDDFSPEDFHQGPPHTIVVFGSEEEEAKFLPVLKNLKFNVHDIDEPGDVAKVKFQSKVKEQQINEAAPLLLPALAAAVRIGVPAIGRLLSQGAALAGKAAAKNPKTTAVGVAAATNPDAAMQAVNIAKNTYNLVSDPAAAMSAAAQAVWNNVADAAKNISAIAGDNLSADAAKALAAVAVKYALPAAAVVAVLYGGKKLHDYMQSAKPVTAEADNLSEEKKLNKDYINAISGMYHLGMSPGYDFYRFSVHVAGNQGGYDTGLGTEGGPFAYAFTDAEEKMIQDAVKAVGGKIKKITPRGSRESADVNKNSPVASTKWKKDLYK